VGQRSRTHCLLALMFASTVMAASAAGQKPSLEVSASEKDGSYTILAAGRAVIHANAAVKVDGKWFRAAEYPEHHVSAKSVDGALGTAKEWSVASTSEKGAPSLLVRIRTYTGSPFGELQVTATNSTGKPIEVQSIRLLDAVGEGLLDLGGPPAADRVLSDSFSEDRPAMQLRDLTNAENQVHRGVGSQLVYNQQSRQSWFIGALTSDKFLTVLRLHMAPGAHSDHIASYEIDSTGTTELLKENSLQDSPAQDQVELSLPLAPGEQLASERMLSVSAGITTSSWKPTHTLFATCIMRGFPLPRLSAGGAGPLTTLDSMRGLP
jgi:alpha-galactosidase